MRHADEPTVEVEVLVRATAERVWALVADVALPARFSPELRSVEWLDGAQGPAVGARFLGRNANQQIGEWETVSTMVACEPDRLLEWHVGDLAAPMARWRFELAPDPQGVRLRQWAQVGPGRSGLTYAIHKWPDREEQLVEARLAQWHQGMLATVEGIRALAESASPAQAAAQAAP